ncbi:MAG: exonuclease domain-containing protein, partial [Legionellaceae bacterium]|nr:exonuclease domain-containing protein [Legionellaceae bacterium]
MSETFFWYDYETFGIDPKGDRPAQFAGIRTNLDLEEIDAPVKVYCKPSLDALPSATSCFITSITPQFCQKEGLLEHAFASSVHRELSRPNTIGVGFNSIKFDDEFNRFLFWRNLFDPYAYAWDKGCSRWDLLKIIPALYALKPNALTWPADENKIISIKLEQL